MATSIASAGEPSFDAFLGFGLIRPFARGASDFNSAGGRELVESAVGQVLGTICSGTGAVGPDGETTEIHGEIPWRPEFGSRLYLLLHRKGPYVASLARALVAEALQRWEPRIIVKSASTTFDAKTRTTFLRVSYDLIERNRSGNRVIFANLSTQIPLGGFTG
jgi:phage baseplate assembly protein W